MVFWLTLFGVVLIGSVGVTYLYLIQTSPLLFIAMDFDDNGFVTFSELQYANHYATRQVTENGKTCIEYYALKDGLRLKLECDGT